MAKYRVWFILACCLGLLLATVKPAESFLGNISLPVVGDVPCLVGCGGDRGVVNTRFAGDLVSRYVTGPSVDHFEEAGNRVVDRANEKLNVTLNNKMREFEALLARQREEAITALAAERAKLQEALRQTSEEALQGLDETLRANLREGDEILERRLGNLQTISRHFNIGLASTLRQAAIVLLLIAFGAFAIWAYRAGKPKRILHAAGATIIALVVALGISRFVEWWQFKQVDRELEEHYHQSSGELNYRYASFWASQLQTLHPSSLEYRAFAEKAALLRDVFSRPTLAKTSNGFRELEARARATQALFRKAGLPLDPDVQVAAALVLWQSATDRFHEYVAANMAAHALELYSDDDASPSRRSMALRPLAAHYLRMYLSFPLSDEELQRIGFDIEVSNRTVREEGFRYRKLDELLTSATAAPEDGPSDFPLDPYLLYGDLTAATYRRVIPNYVLMVASHLEAAHVEGSEREERIQKRAQAAADIKETWDRYLAALGSQGVREMQFPLKALTGLTATYQRATAYQDADPLLGVPPLGEDQDKSAVHIRLLELAEPSLNELSLLALSAAAHIDATEQQQALHTFEQTFQEFFSLRRALQAIDSRTDPNGAEDAAIAVRVKAQDLALRSAQLGLFACGGVLGCSNESDTPASFANILHEMTPAFARTIAGGARHSEALRVIAETRSLPLL